MTGDTKDNSSDNRLLNFGEIYNKPIQNKKRVKRILPIRLKNQSQVYNGRTIPVSE